MKTDAEHPRMKATKYSDGEQYFRVDWNKVKPEECILDYDSKDDGTGTFVEIYDTVTQTAIARTRPFLFEEQAFASAEVIMRHLRDEYFFEEQIIRGVQ